MVDAPIPYQRRIAPTRFEQLTSQYRPTPYLLRDKTTRGNNAKKRRTREQGTENREKQSHNPRQREFLVEEHQCGNIRQGSIMHVRSRSRTFQVVTFQRALWSITPVKNNSLSVVHLATSCTGNGCLALDHGSTQEPTIDNLGGDCCTCRTSAPSAGQMPIQKLTTVACGVRHRRQESRGTSHLDKS